MIRKEDIDRDIDGEEFGFEPIDRRDPRGQGICFALTQERFYPSYLLAEDSRQDGIEPDFHRAAIAAVFFSEQGEQLEYWDGGQGLKEACLRELFSFKEEGGSGGAEETAISELAKSWLGEETELPTVIVVFWQSAQEDGYLLELVCPLDLSPGKALGKIRKLARYELSSNN